MPNVASLMERSLPGPAREALRAAERVALANRVVARELYVVGGLVRDILRGEPPVDLDISVVGDGPAFADLLAAALGGTVTMRSEFGTAVVQAAGLSIDVATARTESYAHPGALPDVEASGIEEDLARRDFTINAMAISLGEVTRGELLDPFGGMADVTTRRIRTLHPRSFADDPTRSLRAVRYEARLGFRISPATEREMSLACEHFDAVSPARLLAELKLILKEPVRAEVLRRADELDLLGCVSPSLRVSGRALAAMSDAPDRGSHFHVALVGAGLTHGEVGALIKRLEPPAEWRALLEAGPAYRDIAAVLERTDLRPSEIAELLAPFPVKALEAQLALAPATAQKTALRSWLDELRFRVPLLTGDDLLAEGVPQGPLVGRLLDELRRARLDRAVGTRDDELMLVRRRLPVLLSGNKAGRAGR